MIAKIIPIKRAPISLSSLDYIIPSELQKNIKIGQLVIIPLRKQAVFGLIEKIIPLPTKNSIKLKPITKIVLDKPVLDKKQLDFLWEISEFYHTSLGFLVKNNLLPLQKRKIIKLTTQKQINIKINKSKNNKIIKQPILFTHINEKQKNDYISKKINPKSQSLVLVPEIMNISNISLSSNQKKQAVYITSQLSNKELFEKWLQIWQGEKTIIIGTRRALFLPYFNLTDIFLTDESNYSYKSWDMSPRFHTRDACLTLAKHQQARLHLLTHTPSVETYFFAKKNIYQTNIEILPPTDNIITPTLIDMRIERKKGNYDFMSEELIKKIQEIKKGNIFLFLNKRGTANYVGCRDCGEVLRCNHCQYTLTYHQDQNILKCHYCKTNIKMEKFCAHCQGLNLVLRGPGTQMVENKIKHLFQDNNSVKIIRIDSDINPNLKNITTNQQTLKIIIGTQMAWSYVNWQKLKLMAFIDADSSLFIPEYKISESLWYALRDSQFKITKTDNKKILSKAKLLVQTSHPDNPVFSYQTNPQKFYDQEIQFRQQFHYPPFRFVLKLFYGNQNKFSAHKEALGLVNKLTELTKTKKQYRIIGPIESVPYFNKGKYWQNIIIKIKYDNYKRDVKYINSLLPIGWGVDPNPNTLLSI